MFVFLHSALLLRLLNLVGKYTKLKQEHHQSNHFFHPSITITILFLFPINFEIEKTPHHITIWRRRRKELALAGYASYNYNLLLNNIGYMDFGLTFWYSTASSVLVVAVVVE